MDCTILGIDPLSLISLTVNYAPVSKASKDAEKASLAQESAIAMLATKSGTLKEEVDQLTAQLDAPNIAYQKYVEALRSWTERRNEIIGSADLPDTIEYIKKKIDDLKTLPAQIAVVEKSREQLVEEIFCHISFLVDNYRKLYSPVQEFITNHPIARKQFNLDFNASIFPADLEELFLGKMNQGRKGSFCGLEEGKKVLSSLITAADLQSAAGVKKFTIELFDRLEYDHRSSPKTKSILAEQLRLQVNPIDMLDLIFGLEYLVPKYELRWSGKGSGSAVTRRTRYSPVGFLSPY